MISNLVGERVLVEVPSWVNGRYNAPTPYLFKGDGVVRAVTAASDGALVLWLQYDDKGTIRIRRVDVEPNDRIQILANGGGSSAPSL